MFRGVLCMPMIAKCKSASVLISILKMKTNTSSKNRATSQVPAHISGYVHSLVVETVLGLTDYSWAEFK